MREVATGLFVGDEDDEQSLADRHDFAKWSVLHACKEPHHRHAVGYAGRAVLTAHPEYLMAYRLNGKPAAPREANRLCLNIIDAPSPAYLPVALWDAGTAFIRARLLVRDKVLVHCNEGRSRGPGMALAHLAREEPYRSFDYDHAVEEFRRKYPEFSPKAGVDGFLRMHWDLLRQGAAL